MKASTNRIVLSNVIIKLLGKQRALGSVFTFNETLHAARPDAKALTL